jgi:hypothetical protein
MANARKQLNIEHENKTTRSPYHLHLRNGLQFDPLVSTCQMATSKYTVDAKVPPEFPHVLKEFTREVLRAQPTNIYEFGAQFFRQKVVERESAPVVR